MQELLARSVTDKLRDLAAELCSLDQDLKSNPSLDEAALRDFRQALDNIRMTAWIVSELLNARRTHKNRQAVISFLTAEWLRRFNQMAQDLSMGFGQEATPWPADAAKNLEDTVTLLRDRLRTVGERH